MWLKDSEEAKAYLDNTKLRSLIERDAEYGASPIYLWTETTASEPIEEAVAEEEEGEVRVEDEEATPEPKTREVTTTGAWSLVNDRAPLWMRDPKEISDEEYKVRRPRAHHLATPR